MEQPKNVTLISSGLCSLLVDHGRPSARSLGVPQGGAADRFSLAIGNALVGNPPSTLALEMTLSGATVVSEVSLVCAISGAPFVVRLEGRSIAMNRPLLLQPQQRLSIGGAREGARAYLCVRGGFQNHEVLGSQSSLIPLRNGTQLSCHFSNRLPQRFLSANFDWCEDRHLIRILPGAQVDWFDRSLMNQSFQISPSSNRMGLRLDGGRFPPLDQEMTSEPVCPGTIQITREGQPIILGVDGQTIGGYPKIAQVISADLDRLGQLRPGDEVRFEWVELATAERLFAERERRLREWLTRLRVTE